jgi:hypothetical protein
MPRNLDPATLAELSAGNVSPAFLVSLHFKSGVAYVWSGIGPIAYGGNTYQGVGSLGEISAISEDSEISARGIVLTLSGIDRTLWADCMSDIQIGAPASVLFGLLTAGLQFIGSPYTIFGGIVDQPKISVGGDTLSISLALENNLIDLKRASNRRYTAADQRLRYPTDIGFNWVEVLNDIALRWGS